MWREEIDGAWTQQDELAAVQVETAAYWGQILAEAWGVKVARLKPPARLFKHPDRKAAESARPELTTDPREISAWFAKHMRG